MELSKEKSEEQALIIKQLQDNVLLLDIDYLTECLTKMEKNLSFKESALILDPNPGTVFERHSLESTKLRQLALYLELAKNSQEILKGEGSVLKAKVHENTMRNIFG